MPLFTGRGDEGETDLLGKRVSKDHYRIEVLGALDELNAALGVAYAAFGEDASAPLLQEAQNDLFTIGAELAVASGDNLEVAPPLTGERVAALEAEIVGLEAKVGPQRAFVLPGGAPAAAHLHHARAIARRAERRTVALASEEDVNPEVLRYLNRLSSLLHAMALWANQRAGVEERHPRY
ncbi:MAG: cob(I)yrinic acid a,c-diamide adenosyltransferase [Thermoplasmata archaeon]